MAIREAHTITEPFSFRFPLALIPRNPDKIEFWDFENFIHAVLVPMFNGEDWRGKRRDLEMHTHCYNVLGDFIEWFYPTTLHYPKDKGIECYSRDRLDGMRNQLSGVWYLWKKYERDIRDLAVLCERPGDPYKGNEDDMVRFFSRMQEFRTEIIPAMMVCINRYEKYTKVYGLNRKLPYVMWGIAFVFVLGIIAPLVLGDYESRYCQLSWVWSYALLALSFLPYAISWFVFLPGRKKR